MHSLASPDLPGTGRAGTGPQGAVPAHTRRESATREDATPQDSGPAVRKLAGLGFGGDYNPEQWPEQVWEEDVELMRRAGVNLVSVGVFAWAELEPEPGRFEFGWLDRVLDLLHAGGILVDLATPTAAPPAWFRRRHPEASLVDADGRVLGGAARQSFCPSSAAYAEACARISTELAARYGRHPALALWHIHNEYGGVNPVCYCPASTRAFRRWLRRRYGSLAALNAAWGTSFWGQRYGDWTEIDAPRTAPTVVNPAHQLDFLRFSGDEHLTNYRRERDIVRALSPGVPVTTNFMIANCETMDYWRWADEVDIVSNDHYLRAEQPDNHIELAMAADLTRAVAGGGPWLLMEHSTGAVNWQPRNIAKRPGEMARNTLAHLARGADAALFFQWRAARFGAEKFHSAMVPHGGRDTRIFREVTALGADLSRLAGLRGTRVAADVGIVWDWESWWAVELAWRPSVDLDYRERVSAYYERLWRAGLTADFVAPDGELAPYRLVVVPSLYLTTPATAANLRRYVEGCGTLLVSYFSGIVDANDAVHPGAYPGALREVLGLDVEEFLPLPAGAVVHLGPGGDPPPGAGRAVAAADAAGREPATVEAALGCGATALGDAAPAGPSDGTGDATARGDVWAEDLTLRGAESVLRYLDGPASGGPAVTRHRTGRGVAWYVSTRLSGADLDPVLDGVYDDAGLSPAPHTGLELVRRRDDGGGSYLVAINHGRTDAELPARGRELLTGAPCDGLLRVPAGAVRVVQEQLSPAPSGNRRATGRAV